MKTKVKLISGSRLKDIEFEINSFIKSKEIDIVDLKIALTSYLMVCSIVYKEV